MLIQARPFALYIFTNSVSSSIFLLVSFSAAFFAFIHLTLPPPASASENTLNPLSFTMSEISLSSSPKRVSGLSEPYLFIASSYGTRLSGSCTSRPSVSFRSVFMKPSLTAMTSSSSTNDISRSICVNSGCLSARRSSSRKQRAICMYLSKPASIKSCLNCCGLCGKA